MTVKKVIERHSPGVFTVEDENGNWFIVQLAYKLEELYQKKLKEKTV